MENAKEDFYTYAQDKEWDKCQDIINDLKNNRLVDEAIELQEELELKMEEDMAWNGGSEDGMDLLQDK